jgi:hypothetical protein
MRKAQGIAGARCEMEVYKADPKFWLLCGPGREKYNPDGTVAEEGWVKPGTRPPIRETKPCACCGHRDGQPIRSAFDQRVLELRAEAEAELLEVFPTRAEKEAMTARTAPSAGQRAATDLMAIARGLSEALKAVDNPSNQAQGVKHDAKPAAAPAKTNGAAGVPSQAQGVKDDAKAAVAHAKTSGAAGVPSQAQGVKDDAKAKDALARYQVDLRRRT